MSDRTEQPDPRLAALQEAKDAAEAANRAKSQFLANISHEVRTPMGAILGYADMLLDPSLPADERTRCLQAIRRNGKHLLELLNDILDLSKIEAGKFDVAIEPSIPWKIATEVYMTFRLRAEEKGVHLRLQAKTPLPDSIDTDAGRLRQILVNLVSNAIKFTDAGKSVRVMLFARPEQERGEYHMAFVVDDEGIGIRPDRIADLFQPFQQLDSSMTRRHGGSGLGLSISKKLAELLGGTISVDSTVGRGSRFELKLPLAIHNVNQWSQPAELGEGPMPVDGVTVFEDRPAARRGSILVAEDTADIRRILDYHLGRAGFSLVFAENGKLAVDAALAGRFDIVLMDMQMPEMDGYEATRQLRQKGYRRPIIALTAHAMQGEREKCLQAGCDEYLPKPIETQILLATLGRFLMEAPAPAASVESEEFRRLVRDYRESLFGNIDELRRATEARDWPQVKALAHRNKGTAGVFEFAEMSETAGLLEQAIEEKQDDTLLVELVDEFCRMAATIAAG